MWVLVSMSARGLVPEDLSSEFAVQSYTVEEGLPQNSVTRITQTPDGYLWFATYRGLVRFDGVQFTVFDSGNTPEIAGDDVVIALNRYSRGQLAVVFKDGGLVWVEGGRIRRGNGTNGLPAEPLRLWGESPDGFAQIVSTDYNRRYVGIPAGNFVLQEKGWVRPDSMEGVQIDSDGVPWIRDPKRGTWEQILANDLKGFLSATSASNTLVHLTARSRNGGIWVAGDRGIHLWEDRGWKRSVPTPEVLDACSAGLEDRSGNFWAATWTGDLWRLDLEGRFHRYRISRTAHPEAIRALFEDSEGNLWIGTEGRGLIRLARKSFQTVSVAQGLSGEVVRSVTEGPDGAIWTAHRAGFESFQPGGRPAIQRAGDFPWCVFGDSRGRVWMGTYGGGLSVLEGGRQMALEPIDSEDRRTITVVFEGPGKEIWVGRENGLWRLDGSRMKLEALPSAVSGMAVRALVSDQHSRLWLGLEGGGLLRREAGGWIRVPIPGVDGPVTVPALLADSKGSVWAAMSGRGLCRFRDDTAAIRLESGVDGLPRRPSSLLEDGLGNFWIGSSDGIFRVRAADLEAWADGRRRDVVPRRFGRGDGLESSECAASVQPSAWRSRDNRLWFATFRGVSVVDPGRLDPEPPPPPIWVEEAILWGREKSRIPVLGQRELDTVLEIPADTHLLEVHYTAPRFSAGDRVRFRYRLVGLDSDWVEAGSRRVAYYQGLGVGTYRFEVSACNQEGNWNPYPARVTLRKQPHFWETWPFRGAMAAGLFVLAFAAYRFRVRAFTRIRRAREEYSRRLIASQESERQRIARELHDSLGQNLLVIKSRVALAQQQAAHPERVADQLREAAEMTSVAIREVREISQNLRPFQLDELGLTKAVIAALRKVAAVSPVQFSFDVGELQGVFPLESEIHVFRILQECLNNVVKHSGAARCRLTVAVQTAQVRIEVEDDGHGFGDRVQPLGSVTREGDGLSNIEERARILGGTVEFGAGASGGARVSVTLPRVA